MEDHGVHIEQASVYKKLNVLESVYSDLLGSDFRYRLGIQVLRLSSFCLPLAFSLSVCLSVSSLPLASPSYRRLVRGREEAAKQAESQEQCKSLPRQRVCVCVCVCMCACARGECREIKMKTKKDLWGAACIYISSSIDTNASYASQQVGMRRAGGQQVE